MADPFDTELANLQRMLDDDGRATAEQGSPAKRPSSGSGASPAWWRRFFPSNETVETPVNLLAGGAGVVSNFLHQPDLPPEYRKKLIEEIIPKGPVGPLVQGAYQAGKNILTEGINTADRWLSATQQLPGAKPTDTLVAPAGTEDYSINPNRVEGHDTLAPLGLAGMASPLGSLASGAGRRTALDMSKEARMARAKEQGFAKEAYHGTASSFPSFSREFAGTAAGDNPHGAHWFSNDPAEASLFADLAAQSKKYGANAENWPESAYGEGRYSSPDSSVMPARLRLKNPYVAEMGSNRMGITSEEKSAAIEAARAGGHDGVIFRGATDMAYARDRNLPPPEVYAVFEPSNIRSTNAAFDAEQAGSANLLAANDNRSSWLGNIANALMGRDDGRASVGASRETVRPSVGAEGLPTEAASSSISRNLNQGEIGAGRNVEKVSHADSDNVYQSGYQLNHAGKANYGGSEISYIGHSDGSVHLEDIETLTPSRGLGDARHLLEDFLRQADKEGRAVDLKVRPGAATDEQRLRAFYESLGFKPAGSEKMVRPAQSAGRNVEKVSPAALERLAAEGFDTSKTYYRGTTPRDPVLANLDKYTERSEPWVFLAQDRGLASTYGDVAEFHAKGKVLEVDSLSGAFPDGLSKSVVADLRKRGYDAVAAKEEGEFVVFDPSNARRVDSSVPDRPDVRALGRDDFQEKAAAVKELYAKQGMPVVPGSEKERPMAEQGTDPNPFDAALRELAQMLADGGEDDGGGGGGIGSDARMPVQPVTRDPRLERQIQVRASRGMDPTPEQDAYLRAIAPEKAERSERLAGRDMPLVPYLPAELSMIPQAGRAMNALGKAYEDPSIPSATNAAVQTGLAALRPVAALKALGAGYGAALADDLGAFGGNEAQAQAKKGAPSKTLPGLLPEQQAEYDALDKKLASGDFGSSAERRMIVERHRELRTISDKYATSKNEGAQAEYNRRGEAADAAFKREMARDKRFADSTVGKVFEETAGVTPLLAAAGTGLAVRAAMKPSLASNYLLPGGLGLVEGAIVPNVPLGTDAYILPPSYNPVKAGYEAGARELPNNDPRRAEWLANAAREEVENPVRAQAAKEFYDPQKLKERTLFGAAEGLVGGILGAKAPAIAGRAYDGAKSYAGRWLRGEGPGDLPTTAVPGGGTPVAANRLSQPSTAGATSSGEILPPLASRNALAGPDPARDRLVDRIGKDPVPEPARPPNRSNLPEWASEPPPNVKLKSGQYWNAKLQQPMNVDGTFAEMPKYSAPRGKKEGNPKPKAENSPPEKPGVQMDDTRPYGRNNLDPDE